MVLSGCDGGRAVCCMRMRARGAHCRATAMPTFVATVLLLAFDVATAQALPSPYMLGAFGDGMVLQHSEPRVHGCGVPSNSKVVTTLQFPAKNETIIRAVAGADGCFDILLPRVAPQWRAAGLLNGASLRLIGCDRPTCAGGGAYAIAEASGVLFGHIVLCSGQSNMVHPLSYDYNASAQLRARSELPNLRLLQVGRQWAQSSDEAQRLRLGCTSTNTTPSLTPSCAVRNIWRSPAIAAAGFSAVCYLTAQELMRSEWGSGAAVGLVEADWGGSAQQPWQSLEYAKSRGCPIEPQTAPRHCPVGSPPSGGGPTRNNDWGCLYYGMILPLRSLAPELVLWCTPAAFGI
jgi:hypothetical protein